MLSEPILAVVDHKGEPAEGYTLTGPGAGLITLARSLTTGPVITVVLNIAPDREALEACGAERVLLPELGGANPRVAAVAAEVAASALAKLAAEGVTPAAVLCVSNFRGKEIAGRLGYLTGGGGAADVTELSAEGGQLVAKKAVLQGTWQSQFAPARGIPVIAVAPSALPTSHSRSENTTYEPLACEFSPAALGVAVEESHWQVSAQASLTEARAVVCVGRGGVGAIPQAQELAELLGGAVGATRVVTDEGHLPRSAQIGQTGVSVSPDVYLGLGVSGALHHASGITGAGQIAAIVDDPDAEILKMADLGVIGRVEDVLPQVIDQLRAE